MDFEQAKESFQRMSDQQVMEVSLEFFGSEFLDFLNQKINTISEQNKQSEFSNLVEKALEKPGGEETFFQHCPKHCSYRDVITDRGDDMNRVQRSWFNSWQYSGYSGKTIFEIAKMLKTMHRPETKTINHALLSVPTKRKLC